VNRVADIDRLEKLPVLDFQERNGPHARTLAAQTGHQGESQQSVRDRFAKRCLTSVFVVYVQRVIIASQAGKIHDIRFRDRSPKALPTIANREILEIEWLSHIGLPTFQIRTLSSAQSLRYRKLEASSNAISPENPI
jgi:hypothetical protein